MFSLHTCTEEAKIHTARIFQTLFTTSKIIFFENFHFLTLKVGSLPACSRCVLSTTSLYLLATFNALVCLWCCRHLICFQIFMYSTLFICACAVPISLTGSCQIAAWRTEVAALCCVCRLQAIFRCIHCWSRQIVASCHISFHNHL